MAYAAQNTTLQVQLPNTSYASLGDVTSISVNGISVAELDTSSLGTTSKTAAVGIRENGTISLSIYMFESVGGVTTDAQYYLRPVLYKSGGDLVDAASWRLLFGGDTTGSAATYVTFSAYVTSLNVSAAVDGIVQASVTLRITGSLTWTN
jgi:hypothetical protein